MLSQAKSIIVDLKTIALEKDSIVNCDETWCKVRKYDHCKKCYIWLLPIIVLSPL